MIRVHIEALQPYLNLLEFQEFINFHEDKTQDEVDNISENLDKTYLNVVKLLQQLKEIDEEFGKKFVGASYTAEKVVRGLSRAFSNAATLQVDNLQQLYVLANEATAISNF